MAKFYVQSGTLRAIVDSVDVERAALWAVHTVMEQVIPLEPAAVNSQGIETESTKTIALGETIQLSEVGFDRDDCMTVDTIETFHHWNLLVQAIDKLQHVLS